MERKQGFYALVQFSPEPERFEFINIGVVLLAPSNGFFDAKFVSTFTKIDRVFGRQKKPYMQALVQSFSDRLRMEFANGQDLEGFRKFANLRANNIRFSSILPVLVGDPREVLCDLFEKLVDERQIEPRAERVLTKLKRAFEDAGVIDLVEEPEPIKIDEFEISISAPYAYQNGTYNLIDAAKLGPSVDDAFKEASKRAIAGQLLAKKTEGRKKLIIVGDFGEGHLPKSYDSIRQMLREHDVNLLLFQNLSDLFTDIRRNFALHS